MTPGHEVSATSIAAIVVCLTTLVLGVWGMRLARGTSDFYVAGRTVGPWRNASAIGGEYLSAASFLGVAGLVLAHLRGRVDTTNDPASALTPRESEVLRMVAKGLASKQIASRLGLSSRTVDNHVAATLRKLHLANRVELTRFALENGLD